MHRPAALACAVALGVFAATPRGQTQEPAAPRSVAPSDLNTAIGRLGDLDYDTRVDSARLIRRTPGEQAVPALQQAVASHKDGYVRYRALVLLTGFNDPRTRPVMEQVLSDPNDRLRTVAYSFFEHEPDPAMVSRFLAALDKEQGEFARPALVRALAPLGKDPRVQQTLVREAGRGENFFRSVVIEALGDYKALYAFESVTAVATLDGPLQDDAAMALGKLGDKRGLETLAALQRSAPRARQPTIAAAICLLGVNCSVHENYLIDTLKFAERNTGFQELLRATASGLGTLAAAGRESAVAPLFDVGIPSRDPARAPIALAVAGVALRNPPLMLKVLGALSDNRQAIALMAEGFDMLEEDLSKERFFAFVRRTYWAATDGSPARTLMQTLISTLDF